jgi:hypothetical protein
MRFVRTTFLPDVESGGPDEAGDNWLESHGPHNTARGGRCWHRLRHFLRREPGPGEYCDPVDKTADRAWVEANAHWVYLALSLVPYAGIAFLWFIGVIRDRLGGLEDRFFATIFLGSGLLFVALRSRPGVS